VKSLVIYTGISKKLSSYRLAVSLISFGEIYHGAYTYANPQVHIETFRQFIAPFRVLSVNEAIMERFGEVRAVLFRQGKIISDFDILIGATALYYNLTVFTFNIKHFERIPDLQIYKPN